MPTIQFDEVITHLGDFGRYQKRTYVLLCLPAIACAMHKLIWVFLGAVPSHRCSLPFDDDPNSTYFYKKNVTDILIPMNPKTHKWEQCIKYDVNYTDFLEEESISNTTSTIPCNEFVFDLSKEIQTSAAIDYLMVCERAWISAMTQATLMAGVLLGSIIFGDLSDRFGRRPIFFASLIIMVVFGLLAGLIPSYEVFVICRMFVGASTSGVFLVAYVIAMEMVGPSKRLIVGTVCQYFYTLGYLIIPLLAYLIRDWRTLQIVISVPGIVFVSYWWIIPESARWLVSQGRLEEAKAIVAKAAKVNKVSIPKEILESEKEELVQKPVQKASVLDLFKNKTLCLRSLNIYFNWFVNSGTYYGLALNTSNIGGNPYFNFLVAGAVEIPAYAFVILSLNRFGRRLPLCSCMILAGILLLLTLACPEDNPTPIIILSTLGKMIITASYGMIYVFSAEIFPTVVRSVGIGSSSMCARIGGILAPFILLLGEIWKPLPLILFGAFAVTGGLLALLLPETKNRSLPETIEDGEKF